MASVENLAAGARAVFFSVAYPDPQDGFTTKDAGDVFAQLEALFGAARGVADPKWLGARAEIGGADRRAASPRRA